MKPIRPLVVEKRISANNESQIVLIIPLERITFWQQNPRTTLPTYPAQMQTMPEQDNPKTDANRPTTRYQEKLDQKGRRNV